MLIPLSKTKKGEQIAIRCLTCNCTDACKLQKLGCFEGKTGKVISNQKQIILQIGETRLAISDVLANSILVSTD